jgi:hypothetical protein
LARALASPYLGNKPKAMVVTKLDVNKDITKFGAIQAINILFYNSFIIDSTFFLLKLNEVKEGATKVVLEVQ